MAINLTTGLTDEMKTFYESVFLARAEMYRVYEEGAQKKTHSGGQGKTISFTRYTKMAVNTTALTEGVNPSEVVLSEAAVTCSLAEYGALAKISKFLSLTSIDRNNKEKIELFGQNMGETLDTLVRNELITGATAQLAGGHANLSEVAASDTLSALELRKAVKTLEVNGAMKYDDGFYMGKIVPQCKFDFTGDSTWVNAKTYSDVKDLYRNEMGELHGIRLLLSNNGASIASGASSGVVYYNFVHGKEAFGTLDLEGDAPRLYIKTPGAGDTSNPADRFSTIAWAGSFVAKTLNADWLINIKAQASVA